MNKRQLTELLEEFFSSQPGRTFSFKEIFRTLHLDTHPLKMLAIDIMEEMTWEEFLVRVTDSSYRLNDSGQVQEGRFVRKQNGKNSFIPDGSDKPIFVSERNSMGALSGDRVKVSFMARRKNHIKEAQVIEVLDRAKDTFVGRLKVDRDIAYLVPQADVFAHNIIIPRRKTKGGKTDDLVARKAYAEIPPRVEYSLTERGKTLLPLIDNLLDWAVSNMDDIVAARMKYLLKD